MIVNGIIITIAAFVLIPIWIYVIIKLGRAAWIRGQWEAIKQINKEEVEDGEKEENKEKVNARSSEASR